MEAGLPDRVFMALKPLQQFPSHFLKKIMQRPRILLCPGYKMRLSAQDLTVFDGCDVQVFDVLVGQFGSILDMASRIFDEILVLEWTQFYLVGWDISAMAMLQLTLLLNGRDDINCLGLVAIGTSIMKPAGNLLKQIEEDDKLFASVLEFDLSFELHLLKVPVVWIHGTRDELVYIQESNICLDNPKFTLYRINATHTILDEPEQLIQIIKTTIN